MHSFQVQTYINTENSKFYKDDQCMNNQEVISLSTTHDSIVDPPHKINSLLFTRSWCLLNSICKGKNKKSNNLHISTMKSTL